MGKVNEEAPCLRTSRLKASTVPPLRIDGIDGAITWPLSSAHVAALAALDVPNGKLLPTSFAFVQPTAWREIVQDELQQKAAYGFMDAALVFSHLVVDAVGTGATLMPLDMPPDAFGYMVLHLPSAYDGGEMTFSYRYTTETWTPNRCKLEMVTTFRDLVPASTPITKGVRMALVYRLGMVDYNEDGFPMPCDLSDGIDAFKRIADMPLHTYQRLAVRIDDYELDTFQDPADFLRFDYLDGLDASLVDTLLATELYDIALVAFAKQSTDDDDEDDEDDYAYEPNIENKVAACKPHPRCQIPADVLAALIGSCVDAVLCDGILIDDDEFKCPPVALVFWLKRYRPTLLGLDAVLPLVQEAIANNTADQPCLGRPTVRDVLLRALGAFHSDQYDALFEKGATNAPLTLLCDVLLALDDVELVVIFLRDAVFVGYCMGNSATAACIHACLLQYGWERLAPVIFGILTRWYQAPPSQHARLEAIPIDCAPRLLASLAGITTEAVCPPLKQPFVCEFIKACYHHVLSQRRFVPDTDNYREAFRRFATHVILLDWYLDECAPNAASDSYLGAFLPPSMILAVESFLYTRQPGTSTLLAVYKTLAPAKLLLQLPAAIALALVSQPTIPLDLYVGVIEQALVTFNATQVRYEKLGTTVFANVLDVLDRAGRCGMARFEAVWTLLSPASLAGTRQLLQQRTLRDDVRAGIASLVLALAPTLSTPSHWQVTQTSCYTSWEQPGLIAVEVLATVDPTQVPTLLQLWLEAMDLDQVDARDPARELYVPLAQLLANVVPQHVDEMEAVAQRCLAVIGDVRSRPPLPDITDYVFGDIQLDASHCELCARFVGFLNNGTRTRLELFETMCDPGQRCVDANRHRLEVQYHDGGISYVKVQPSGGVSEYQLNRHIKAQRVDADDRARVAALMILLANAPQKTVRGVPTKDDNDDEARHLHLVKRQRRPGDT